MNISIIQQIRAADSADRFTILAQGLSNGRAETNCFYLTTIELAMHMMEKVFFSIGSNSHHLVLMPTTDVDGRYEKVVIADNEDGCVVKKEEKNYPAYGFLKDYLGLGGKDPFSIEQAIEKYPNVQQNTGSSEAISQAWYDSIAFSLLETIYSRIHNPVTDFQKIFNQVEALNGDR